MEGGIWSTFWSVNFKMDICTCNRIWIATLHPLMELGHAPSALTYITFLVIGFWVTAYLPDVFWSGEGRKCRIPVSHRLPAKTPPPRNRLTHYLSPDLFNVGTAPRGSRNVSYHGVSPIHLSLFCLQNTMSVTCHSVPHVLNLQYSRNYNVWRHLIPFHR